MRREISFMLFFILIASFIPTLSADILSVNSGGTGNIILGPDRFIEGFFFGGICGDGVVDSGVGEQCDDGGIVSGDGCSSTCQTEVVTPPSPPGGGGAIVTTSNIVLSPTQINVNLAVNTNTERIISVTNIGSSTVTVFASQIGLDNQLIFGSTNLTINAGQSKNLNVVLVALGEPGIFTGKIIIGGKVVLVTLNIQTELLLFDSNIVVLNNNFEVRQGGDLKTLVTLIPMGDPSRLDVTLNFVIKDFSNKVYLTKSETLLVSQLMEINRDFDTGNLPLGNFVIGLELVYPNGVAPSSANFVIVEGVFSGIFGKIVLFLIILIMMILIALIILLIVRRVKERKRQKSLSPFT
ncbi:MAG TPA: hypothetical protein ENH99_01120 [Candidatus Pacearchaeota archaeon]|nr:hypothetical protein [Candidatus Pacearchaeota archaeon]